MTIDVDSTVWKVHGHHKGGAAYGYTRLLGYHPLLASRADTGELLHLRMRTGSANTARGSRNGGVIGVDTLPRQPRGRSHRPGWWGSRRDVG